MPCFISAYIGPVGRSGECRIVGFGGPTEFVDFLRLDGVADHFVDFV